MPTDLKISKCGAVMHEIRNGLLCIQGMLLCIDSKTPLVDDINGQIQRIAVAISKCDLHKTGCGSCKNGVPIHD